MNCKQAREEIGDLLLQEELSVTDIKRLPTTVLDHAEACPRCGRLLESVRLIARRDQDGPKAPESLSERIVNSLPLQEGVLRRDNGPRRHAGRREKEASKAEPRRRLFPGIPTWAFASAAAVLLILLSVTVTTFVLSPFRAEPEVVVVRLELRAPGAEAVSVVGDWNGWNPDRHPMSDDDDDGVWQVEIEVIPDKEYQYQFLINGERWIADPDAPIAVDDGFGGQNSVLNI